MPDCLLSCCKVAFILFCFLGWPLPFSYLSFSFRSFTYCHPARTLCPVCTQDTCTYLSYPWPSGHSDIWPACAAWPEGLSLARPFRPVCVIEHHQAVSVHWGMWNCHQPSSPHPPSCRGQAGDFNVRREQCRY
jgi:hypothetical protein